MAPLSVQDMEMAPPPIKGQRVQSSIFWRGRWVAPRTLSVLLARANAGEALVELRDLAARINNALLAGPGRVRLRVDVEEDGIARLSVAGRGFTSRPGRAE